MNSHEKAMLVALVRLLDNSQGEAEIVEKLDAYYESALTYLRNQEKPSAVKVVKRPF